MLASLIRALRAWGIEPIFVFDGKSPREKDGTRSARRRQKAHIAEEDRIYISTEDRNEVKQLFYALGVLALNAEMEADSLLAFLARRGDIAAVISSDMDFLPRGVPLLLIPNTLTDLTTWRAAALSQLLAAAKLTYDEFVSMCVLMGCDYAPTIPTISYQLAYWRIREGRTMLEILAGEGVRTATAWETAVSLLRGEKDRWDTVLSAKQREKWAAGAPPAEPNAPILRAIGVA
jgi:flap endonuclease-1